jgi:hypothetical protein
MRKLLSLAAAVSLGVPALAQQEVVIPQGMATTYAGNTGLTWRNTAFRFQMIYDPAHFLGQGIDYPITINRLRFRAINGATSAGGETYSGVTVAMSSSPNNWSVASTTFAANTGADVATVYSGNVVCAAATGATPNNDVIDITLQTPFVYDPTAGLDLCLDVTAPTAPVPTGVPNMAASSNATHLARRNSTATPTAATGALSYFASVVKIDFTPPANLGSWTAFGDGCNDTAVSFYENLGVGTFDLSGTPGAPNSIRLNPTGTGYNVTPGTNAWFTPTSPNLALTDDSLSPAQPLGFTFNYPGGSTTDVLVCSNGFIWLDTTQTAATFSGTPALLLGQGARLAPLWHDMDPTSAGTIHFDVDPSGTAAYVTWDQVPLFNFATTLNTMQVAIFADGSVEYRYQACTSDPGLFGWSPGGNANDPGSIDVSASLPFTTVPDQFPLTLVATTRPVVNKTLNFEVRNVPANTTLMGLNWGFAPMASPIELSFIGAPTCYQNANVSVATAVTVASPTSTYAINVPNDPSLNGANMYVQALCDSQGINAANLLLSNGVDLAFGLN